MKNKVAIYTRVSTHFQIDRDSLQVQERELIGYAQYVLGTDDYTVFKDAGYSAKNTERPDYQAMMERIRTGEFSHLLVWKIDRISRNLLDFSAMYKELKHLGVIFVSKNEQFDTGTAMGEAMLKIILVFAELERKMTAERVTSVMLSRATNGQWNGGNIPLGYRRENGVFVIDEREATTYRILISKYEETRSTVKTAGYLNNNGFTRKSGNKWSSMTVDRVLRNPWYKGDYIYNVCCTAEGKRKNEKDEWIVVSDHHPALIDERRFESIGKTLSENRRKGKKIGDTYTGKHINIFAGVLRCSKCGSNLASGPDRERKSGYRPSKYACSEKRRGLCTSSYASDIRLVPVFFQTVSAILRASKKAKSFDELNSFLHSQSVFLTPDSVNELIHYYSESKEKTVIEPPQSKNMSSIELERLKSKKISLEATLNRLMSLYLNKGAIAEKDYILKNSEIRKSLADVENRIAQLSIKDDTDCDKKASYFIMVNDLQSGNISLKHFRAMNKEVPKQFVVIVTDHIDILDGEIEKIVFKNGLTIVMDVERMKKNKSDFLLDKEE